LFLKANYIEMKRTNILTTAAIVMALFLGINFNATASDFNLQTFESLTVSTDIDVELVKAETNRATFELENADMKDLIIKQEDGDLSINFKSGFFSGNNKDRKATVTLYYNGSISNINLSAGATVKASESIESNTITATVSSGAFLCVPVICTEFQIDINDGGAACIDGETFREVVRLSNGSQYKGDELKSKKLDVQATTGAMATVLTDGKFMAQAEGGAEIVYAGNPQQTIIDAGYTGSVVQAN